MLYNHGDIISAEMCEIATHFSTGVREEKNITPDYKELKNMSITKYSDAKIFQYTQFGVI